MAGDDQLERLESLLAEINASDVSEEEEEPCAESVELVPSQRSASETSSIYGHSEESSEELDNPTSEKVRSISSEKPEELKATHPREEPMVNLEHHELPGNESSESAPNSENSTESSTKHSTKRSNESNIEHNPEHSIESSNEHKSGTVEAPNADTGDELGVAKGAKGPATNEPETKAESKEAETEHELRDDGARELEREAKTSPAKEHRDASDDGRQVQEPTPESPQESPKKTTANSDEKAVPPVAETHSDGLEPRVKELKQPDVTDRAETHVSIKEDISGASLPASPASSTKSEKRLSTLEDKSADTPSLRDSSVEVSTHKQTQARTELDSAQNSEKSTSSRHDHGKDDIPQAEETKPETPELLGDESIHRTQALEHEKDPLAESRADAAETASTAIKPSESVWDEESDEVTESNNEAQDSAYSGNESGADEDSSDSSARVADVAESPSKDVQLDRDGDAQTQLGGDSDANAKEQIPGKVPGSPDAALKSSDTLSDTPQTHNKEDDDRAPEQETAAVSASNDVSEEANQQHGKAEKDRDSTKSAVDVNETQFDKASKNEKALIENSDHETEAEDKLSSSKHPGVAEDKALHANEAAAPAGSDTEQAEHNIAEQESAKSHKFETRESSVEEAEEKVAADKEKEANSGLDSNAEKSESPTEDPTKDSAKHSTEDAPEASAEDFTKGLASSSANEQVDEPGAAAQESEKANSGEEGSESTATREEEIQPTAVPADESRSTESSSTTETSADMKPTLEEARDAGEHASAPSEDTKPHSDDSVQTQAELPGAASAGMRADDEGAGNDTKSTAATEDPASKAQDLKGEPALDNIPTAFEKPHPKSPEPPKTAAVTHAKSPSATDHTPSKQETADTVYLYTSMASGVRGTMARFNRAATILKSYDIDFVPVEITLDERALRLWKLKGVSKNKTLPAIFRDGDMKCDFNELVEANEIEDVEDLIFDGL